MLGKLNMESLFCDEEWLSSPATDDFCSRHEPINQCGCDGSCCFYYTSKEEREAATIMFIEKELSYMPQPGYVQYLYQSNNLVHLRFRAIQWLIKCRIRLNLSFGTVCNAANYLDRFISMNRCHEWKYWMVELLSVSCLSVASKFNDTSSPSLHEIQMEGLDYLFQSSTIRRMEFTLLHALGWRLDCITTHSYVGLLLSNFDSLQSHHRNELATQVTNLLLGAVLDVRMLEYQPSVAAVSALWCCLDELIPSAYTHLGFITKLFNHDQKDDVVKCNVIMKSRLVDPSYNLMVCGGQPYNWPSSPVTVLLLRERIDINDCQVDLSIFKQLPDSNIINIESCEKRREEEEEE